MRTQKNGREKMNKEKKTEGNFPVLKKPQASN